jgi:octaprenyl-diphosphate synthase
MRGLIDIASAHQPIVEVLDAQLEQVAVVFERQLASELSAVNALCLHIEKYRGKMLRPTLVLLTGMAVRGETDGESLTHQHRVVAAVVEMIHMATLVHDDVLDEADMRRNGATVNHLWGNEAAVMLGDYLISNAFHLCSTLGEPAINLALGEVTNTLCEGELVQLHHRDDCGVDEATYLEIVRRKTASLIGESCRLGAVLADAPEESAQAMQHFGEALGIAFQIQDDLLDLMGDQRIVGKDLGKDLAKGKLTLPVTHHMSRADQAGRGRLLRIIEQRDSKALREELLASGAVQHCKATAEQYVADAKHELRTLPDSPVVQLLDFLADTVVARSH